MSIKYFKLIILTNSIDWIYPDFDVSLNIKEFSTLIISNAESKVLTTKLSYQINQVTAP